MAKTKVKKLRYPWNPKPVSELSIEELHIERRKCQANICIIDQKEEFNAKWKELTDALVAKGHVFSNGRTA